ncbi:hypothetical protein MMC17_000201 [Xylographa soralifera]|nr:hypothetical protein [Xylographa soralifera]
MSQESTHRVLISDSCSLLVKILSAPSSTSSPLLIATHGGPGISSHRESATSFAHLSSIFRVLVFDARGSGDSDLKPPFTHSRWVADIEELRSWASAEKFVLAGGSYGGVIALSYALAHPDRLLGLILRDTFAYGHGAVMNCLMQVLASKRISPDPVRQLRLWTGRTLSDEDFWEGCEEIVGMYAAKNDVEEKREEETGTEPPSVFHNATHNQVFGVEVEKYDVRARLGEIKVPTLVTVGRHDKICPVSCSEEIAHGISGARLKIFEESGHSPPTEEPEAFQACVQEFAEDLRRHSTH